MVSISNQVEEFWPRGKLLKKYLRSVYARQFCLVTIASNCSNLEEGIDIRKPVFV